MKYYKRLNKHKASNVELCMNSLSAWSYGWWCFYKRINGVWVFNNYNYSPTTQRHQQKIKALLEELGAPIDLVIETRQSLNALNERWDFELIRELNELETKNSNPRARGFAKQFRQERIKKIKHMLNSKLTAIAMHNQKRA